MLGSPAFEVWAGLDLNANVPGLLTIEPNAVVAPILPEAMPVILTEPDIKTWLRIKAVLAKCSACACYIKSSVAPMKIENRPMT